MKPQTSRATTSTTIGAGRISGIALPLKKAMKPAGIWPPGLSMISRVTPWMMNMLDSVTTIDCRRRMAMKKPLKAPTRPPMAMAATPKAICEPSESCMPDARTTLTSEITAPALRSKPPLSTTKVWPIAARASVAPPPD